MPGPIFIIGAMGSGSTLLRLILDSHPNIAIPRETGFMRAYNAHQFIPYKWSGRNWAKRMGWTRKELDEELARFYDRIFMRNVERQGKQRWGDKTPYHTWHVDDMARLFPDAVFVGIVRHPGGCVGSNMNRWGHGVKQASYHYSRYNREIARQAARLGDRFAIVRYEDLVLQPEPLLRELLEWLGEPWSDDVLAHHTVQGARGGRVKVEGRSRVDEPIDTSRIAKWTTRMSEGQRATLQAAARHARRVLRLRRRRPAGAGAAARGRAGGLRHRRRRADRALRLARPAHPGHGAGGRPPLRPAQDPGPQRRDARSSCKRPPKPSLSKRVALAGWRRVPERGRARLAPRGAAGPRAAQPLTSRRLARHASLRTGDGSGAFCRAAAAAAFACVLISRACSARSLIRSARSIRRVISTSASSS